MAEEKLPEFWLRGPISGIIPELQPVAHALLQAAEEIIMVMNDFSQTLLWEKPAGVASVGFHLQHIAGVQDRLLTYALGQQLAPEQLQYLKHEGENKGQSVSHLLDSLKNQFNKTLEIIKSIKVEDVLQNREVGRAKLPSTVLGLLVHIAEHTMRHTGQLLVTVRILKEGSKNQGL
ncbi:MAG TPA: DinB family protein [Chitinophagaceae bacterium]|nr:DinB family protein [Chitinophagaceae bacterium]